MGDVMVVHELQSLLRAGHQGPKMNCQDEYLPRKLVGKTQRLPLLSKRAGYKIREGMASPGSECCHRRGLEVLHGWERNGSSGRMREAQSLGTGLCPLHKGDPYVESVSRPQPRHLRAAWHR